jgi:hypothetical protein
MPASLSTAKQIMVESLGYAPLRMKPVHFATSFFLCLGGSYRRLQLLNKVSNPKATEKRPGDEYVAENLFDILREEEDPLLGASIDLDRFRALRNHLNAAYNNDGAALAAAFPPYSTFGHDYTTPSPLYLAKWSKNHGDAGAFVHLVLRQSTEGQQFLEAARRIFQVAGGPLAMLGAPLVREDPIEYEDEPEEILPHMTADRLSAVSSLMHAQTCALGLLARNLEREQSPYMLRQLIIGIGSWLLVYHIKHAQADSQTVFFHDFVGQSSSRLRVQASSCYSRSLGLFGRSGHLWLDRQPEQEDELRESLDEYEAKVIKGFEEHFRDFSVRIGWVQPRSGSQHKYFRPSPDTLRVILLSVLEEDEICSSPDVARRLHDSWHWVLGLLPEDHQALRSHGYSPLDEDADLRLNRDAFQDLSVRLGLAWEPSDGLVLFSLNPNLHS